MKTYVITPSNTPDDFVHYFHTLIAPHVTKEYVAYYLDICRIFMNAIDDEDEYFIMQHEGVIYKKDFCNDDITGNVMVESLSGDDLSCAIYSKEFAKIYLTNIDTRQSHGVVVNAMFPDFKKDQCVAINTIPLIGIDPFSEIKWSTSFYNFLRGYKATNFKFIDILEDFGNIKVMKNAVEAKFLETWGVLIDIKDYKYIKNAYANN